MRRRNDKNDEPSKRYIEINGNNFNWCADFKCKSFPKGDLTECLETLGYANTG